MTINTLEPSLESSKERLKNFWGSLSEELQKNIGINVSLLMNWSAFTLDPFELVQEEITRVGDATEINRIINEIRSLNPIDHKNLTHQLINYFLSRNPV